MPESLSGEFFDRATLHVSLPLRTPDSAGADLSARACARTIAGAQLHCDEPLTPML
jgi:hypothetical protein